MSLKPQDVLFLLKLVAIGKQDWSFNKLAIELGMSPSQVHAAAKRVLAAGLAVQIEQNGKVIPHIRNLEEFLFHGLKYVFVPDQGGMSRGMPTAYASAPLVEYFPEVNEPRPVWPDPEGKIRGVSLSPLFKSAPVAARQDHKLYELLALVDSLRVGRAREQELAKKELKKRLDDYADNA